MKRHRREKRADTLPQLWAILGEIALAPSGVALEGWQWEATPTTIVSAGGDVEGWSVRASFLRPDRETGAEARGHGRWEFIGRGAPESAVVKTAWLTYELVVRHEAMESFTYGGVRVFDPHHTVAELSMPHAARGRS